MRDSIFNNSLAIFDVINGINDLLGYPSTDASGVELGKWYQLPVSDWPPSEWKPYATITRFGGKQMPVYRSEISGRLHFGHPVTCYTPY
jgi:hypothetical protein